VSWHWGGIRGLKGDQSLSVIDRALVQLERSLCIAEPMEQVSPAAGSVTPQCARFLHKHLQIVVNPAQAAPFTLQNPADCQIGALLTIEVSNQTLGAIGAMGFGSRYIVTGGAWTQPASGGTASIVFRNRADGLLTEIARSPAVAGGGGGGEANTGSNQNAAGVGVFSGKVGVDLQFRGVAAASTKLSAALNAGNKTVDLDVVEANLQLPNMGGQIVNAQIAPNAVGTNKIAASAVTYARIQNVSATARVLGRITAGAGDPEELTAAGGLEFSGTGIQTSARTGDVTKAAGGTVTTIANDAVTYAKMQNVSATDKVLGRQSAGAGDPEEIPCTAAGRALIAGATVLAQRAQLGLIEGQVAADQATFVNAQTNIANMLFAIAASEIWVVDWVISVTMGTAATGVKFYFTFPVGCTGEIHYEGNVATLATWQSLYQAVLTVPGTFFVTGIVTGMVRLRTTIRNAGTAGTIQLVGITGGATTTCAVKKGSSFIGHRQGS
jgi:hypothetical protein